MARRSKSDASGPTRLLVINEDSNSCELVARILESAGWVADRCASESEALIQLASAKPPYKAAIIDLTKSGAGQSVNLLQSIRTQNDLRQLPIIMLTSSAKGQVFAWQSGVDGYLVRPFHSDELISEIQATLGRSSDEREAYREENLRAAQ